MRTQSVAGERRSYVTFEAPDPVVADGQGGYTETWHALEPPAFARITPASAQNLERVTHGAIVSEATHVLTLPYRADLTTRARVLFGSRRFSITGVFNRDERNVELVLTCTEVVA